jgi:hypothetical protein
MMFIYSGVGWIYTPLHSLNLHYSCISVHPSLLYKNVPRGWDYASLEMYLDGVIVWDSRCTWTPWFSMFGDELADCDHARLEAIIVRGESYTWRIWSSEFGDALGTHDPVSLEMHFEAMLVWTWRL